MLPLHLLTLPKFAFFFLDLRFVEHVFFLQGIVLLLFLALFVVKGIDNLLLHAQLYNVLLAGSAHKKFSVAYHANATLALLWVLLGEHALLAETCAAATVSAVLAVSGDNALSELFVARMALFKVRVLALRDGVREREDRVFLVELYLDILANVYQVFGRDH